MLSRKLIPSFTGIKKSISLLLVGTVISVSGCAVDNLNSSFNIQKSNEIKSTSNLSFKTLSENSVLPVLLVISNQDFYYQDYNDIKTQLDNSGISSVVTATTTNPSYPHYNSGQGTDGGIVTPDIALNDVNANDYSAIVFIGGWGASAYQYGYSGEYHNVNYNGSIQTKESVNNLINNFYNQDKYIVGICHGVSVLAWSRVNGQSLLNNRTVTAWNGASPPSHQLHENTTRWHIESNGATMLSSASIGNPNSSHDDVIVDGKIITAENFYSGNVLGQTLAQNLINDNEKTNTPNEEESTSNLPVLLVIANHDFYYQEYSDTRISLENAGKTVVVAGENTIESYPHSGSGQGPDGGIITPDIALRDVNPDNYSAIAFVGGWGSSTYHYSYSGIYYNGFYNGSNELREVTNNLINQFTQQNKIVSAICHGVAVLGWARINGVSPLSGKTVAAWANTSPDSNLDHPNTTRWHIETNGATMVPSHSVGDTSTDTDDVIVDGKIITAENYNSALEFGRVIAEQLDLQ